MGGTKASKSLFPRLTGGPGGIGRSETERHQRGRLEGAMVAAVAKHGYAETTVGELVSLAGVSKSTFYAHFESKEECFLATFETIVDEASSRVSIAYRSQGLEDTEAGLKESFSAAFRRFAEIVVEEAVPATLVVVDSLTLGRAALDQRQRGFEAFERMIHQSFQQASGESQPSDLAVRVLVAGVWTVVYRCIRSGRPEELGDHLEPIVSWALSYRNPIELPPRTPRPSPNGETGAEAVDWNEPPDSPRSRRFLSQRDRIVRAAAQVAAEIGYANLTIPAISAAAGTSNQTFYEHFESKEKAFLTAFEELSDRGQAATRTAAATETEWAAAVEAGMRGLLEHIVAEPLFAKLAFFELPTAGPTALDQADATVKRYTAFLEPRAMPPGIAPLPPVVVEALGGGLWQAIQHEIDVGDLDRLPDFAPQLTAVALTPLFQPR
jgi:AcrR family transcriptional regulator